MKTCASLLIRLVLTPGRCRWCGCAYDHPCANGCSWVERSQTLCSECVPLSEAMRTARGRRELAEFVQEHGFLVGQAMPAAARPRPRNALQRVGGRDRR